MKKNDILTRLLRKNLNLTEDIVSDSELLKQTEGSLLKQRVECLIALDDFVCVVKEEVAFMRKKLYEKMVGL